jgi:hypothetical protein
MVSYGTPQACSGGIGAFRGGPIEDTQTRRIPLDEDCTVGAVQLVAAVGILFGYNGVSAGRIGDRGNATSDWAPADDDGSWWHSSMGGI